MAACEMQAAERERHMYKGVRILFHCGVRLCTEDGGEEFWKGLKKICETY